MLVRKPVMLLDGRDASILSAIVVGGARAVVRAGHQLAPEAVVLVEEIAELGREWAATSDVGSAEYRGVDFVGGSVRVLTVNDVAALDGTGVRNVRGHAGKSLPGVQTSSGAWVFDPDDVAAWIAARKRKAV